MMRPPLVSVVLPAYYSQLRIAAALDALNRQTFRDFETIVVNSSPEGDTERIVREHAPDARFIQSADRLYPHAARNCGVEAARGRLLAFSDPDCQAAPDWLERLIDCFEAGHEIVTGAMGLVDDSALEIGVHLCKYHWALPGLAAGSAWVAPTANALYSRRILDRLGRFDDQAFCGDAVLSWHAARAGAPPFFEPRAIVFHRHDLSFEQFRSSRFVRGKELARERARHEGWSRRSCYLRAVAFPLGLAWVLCAAARHAARARWTRRFLRTLPIQLVGHAAWSLGEAVALVKQREPLGP